MPAGGNGTIRRIEREGKDCAPAAVESAKQRSRLARRPDGVRTVVLLKARSRVPGERSETRDPERITMGSKRDAL
jgi:hypothetical protein